MMAKRSFARLATRSCIALLLLLAALEATLRFGLGLGNPVLIAPDDACSYILKPDQDVFRFFARTHINHYGMRSDELPSVRQPGALRLMFVGDSVTYATTRVDQREIFTEVIHHDLPALVHRPVEVLNASAGGWAPDNELAYLRSRGTFQSDIVLLVLNDGDLTQPTSTMASVGDDLPSKRPLTAIGEVLTRYIRPRLSHLLANKDAGDSIDRNADGVIRENLADMNSILGIVKSQGEQLVVIYIPFRRDMPELSKASGLILKTWTDAHHVAMLDLTSAESPHSSSEITLDDGIHFNARGHLVIAQEIERSWPELAGTQ